ncbi:MAG: hypothetical protein KAH23_03755 [Kiritimatiellae bacterium]|nr:hypothetical protein [Kiritimatiellia bacterium]
MIKTIIKMVATLLAAFMTTGILAAQETTSYTPDNTRREKDSKDKEWILTEWEDGTRPYPKNLKKREEWYKEKWGEHWAGKKHKSQGGEYTMSPGIWKHEEIVVIPEGRRALPGIKGFRPRMIKSQAIVYAPGDGENVTAIYAATSFGVYHVDPKTKAITFAGKIPSYEYLEHPKHKGKLSRGKPRLYLKYADTAVASKDGIDGEARACPTQNNYGNWFTADPVLGRVYFLQGTVPNGKGGMKSPSVIRYAEQLRPYMLNGKKVLLPGFLDYKKMYAKVNASPVMIDGKRAPAHVSIRTVPIPPSKMGLPGPHAWGKRMILSPDGQHIYMETKSTWPGTFNQIHAFNVITGKDTGSVPVKKGSVPKRFCADAHSATSGRFDGHIYQAFHPGCGTGPGRLFSINLANGSITKLYDSLQAWPSLTLGGDKKNKGKAYKAFKSIVRKMDSNDGPADAVSLRFTTTCYQLQCPRTGAVINGGWDCSGLRRYHDGFVTSIAQTRQMGSRSPRPEWKGQHVAPFGSLQSSPDAAPDGSIYVTGNGIDDKYFENDSLRLNGLRIVRIWRTDWPAKQPVNGYANKFLSLEKREKLMLEYAKNYIKSAGL